MRILKFRGWDKNENEMVYDLSRLHCDFDFCKPQEFGLEDFILMQSTGILDDEGIEIFEDDILKSQKDEEYSTNYYAKVYWDIDRAMWRKLILADNVRFTEALNTQENFSSPQKNKITWKIVGNVHENGGFVK